VYIVGVAQEERRNAFTAVWAVPVSFKPLLLAVSINPEHSSYPLLMEGRAFSVNVLQRGQIDLARHFGTRSSGDLDKLAGIGLTYRSIHDASTLIGAWQPF
jgi:flavin reductase (DIM6/NTAB) family NADH-FMN oxidoreductase RutF